MEEAEREGGEDGGAPGWEDEEDQEEGYRAEKEKSLEELTPASKGSGASLEAIQIDQVSGSRFVVASALESGQNDNGRVLKHTD